MSKEPHILLYQIIIPLINYIQTEQKLIYIYILLKLVWTNDKITSEIHLNDCIN